jgi:hypothetical protein
MPSKRFTSVIYHVFWAAYAAPTREVYSASERDFAQRKYEIRDAAAGENPYRSEIGCAYMIISHVVVGVVSPSLRPVV